MKLLLLILLSMWTCTKQAPQSDPLPRHDQFQISSQQLDESRIINVWKPPNYEEGGDSFPVLYMPDGGINEDFPHIANTLAKLIKEKSIPPLILVGIENTDRGRDLTGFSESEYDAQYCPLTDGAKNFRAFITDELMPEINRKYRTRDRKGIIGESLAGLFVMETFFIAPKTFNFYIAFDPSLWWNDHYLVKNAEGYLRNFPDAEIKLWFVGSNTKDISQHSNALSSILEKNAPHQLNWKYSFEAKEKHHSIFRAKKEAALKWIFKASGKK